MKLPLQLLRDYFGPITPGGRLAVLLLVVFFCGVGAIGYFARSYLAEAVTARDALKADFAAMQSEHRMCMRKLTDAFKEIAELKKQLKSRT